jgi:hypothetical protein
VTALAELGVSGDPESWRRCGLAVDADGVMVVGPVRFVITADRDARGALAWWGLSAAPGPLPDQIDGIPTRSVEPVDEPAGGERHRLGAIGVDHVVVMTPSLERTCDALAAATAEPLKRVREAGGGVMQGFHRFGPVVVEVVQSPAYSGDGPALLWGFVLTVSDLDAAVRTIGPELVSAPKPAVQPGRSIATVRSGAGLGVAVALMTPEPPRR